MKKIIFSFLSSLSLLSAEPISEEINAFGSDFYQQSLIYENICFSPYSLFSGLSTAYLGAKEDTAAEMAKALHIDPEDFSKIFSLFNKKIQSNHLNSANAIWLGSQISISNEYQHVIQDLDIEVKNLDFSNKALSSSMINSWVAKKTNNKISYLIAPSDISKTTQAILTNAIHFQSTWIKPFKKNLTTPADFTINDQEVALVQMMKQTGHFPYYENENYQLLELPLSSSYACFFLLPKTSFNNFENTLTLRTLLDQIHLAKHALIEVHLPKFTLEKALNVNEILQSLGIKKAFSPKANFSNLTQEGNLCIDKILHKAYFSLEESGITASAATAVIMNLTATCVKQEPLISFTADHPFIFGIVDLNSDLVLFLGKLTRP